MHLSCLRVLSTVYSLQSTPLHYILLCQNVRIKQEFNYTHICIFLHFKIYNEIEELYIKESNVRQKIYFCYFTWKTKNLCFCWYKVETLVLKDLTISTINFLSFQIFIVKSVKKAVILELLVSRKIKKKWQHGVFRKNNKVSFLYDFLGDVVVWSPAQTLSEQ